MALRISGGVSDAILVDLQGEFVAVSLLAFDREPRLRSSPPETGSPCLCGGRHAKRNHRSEFARFGLACDSCNCVQGGKDYPRARLPAEASHFTSLWENRQPLLRTSSQIFAGGKSQATASTLASSSDSSSGFVSEKR
jgi:hypothetical protein